MLKTIFIAVLIGASLGWMLESCAHAKQPVPIQPGQVTQCWAVIGTPTQTMQCQDGTWEVTRDDGVILHGRGPLPAEFQPPPAEVAPNPLSTFAPGILFGVPKSP